MKEIHESYRWKKTLNLFFAKKIEEWLGANINFLCGSMRSDIKLVQPTSARILMYLFWDHHTKHIFSEKYLTLTRLFWTLLRPWFENSDSKSEQILSTIMKNVWLTVDIDESTAIWMIHWKFLHDKGTHNESLL